MNGGTTLRNSPVLVGLVALALIVGVQSAGAQAEHCPGGGQKNPGSIGGVSFSRSGSTLTMTNNTSGTVTVTWCAKGGEKFSNGSHISGVRSTTIPAGQSRSASFNQDVSYFVIYDVEGSNGNGGQPPPPPGPPPPPPPPPNGEPGIPPGPGGGPGVAAPAPAIPGQPTVTG